MLLTKLDRYIAREILLTLLAVQLTLFVILVSNQALRVLAEVSAGTLPGGTVARLLALSAVKTFARLLPIAFFLGIILAMGRLYKDSEVVVMRACGVSDWALYRPVLLLGVPLVLLQLTASLYLVPWSVRSAELITDSARADAEVAGLRPGRFVTSRDGRITIFVEQLDGEGRMQGVFLHRSSGPLFSVERAGTGLQRSDPATGDRALVLEGGRRYEGAAGDARSRVIEYDRHAVLLQRRPAPTQIDRLGGLQTSVLAGIDDPRARTELAWRTAVPVAAGMLAVIAVPLSRVSPRQGRFGKLAAGVLVYIVYLNLLSIARAWMEQGVVGPVPGFWWVHLLAVAFAATLLAQQNRWLARWRHRREVAA